ncbi:MAG: hypothetical protein ACREBG_12195 [Pyrinomonadaceae bacterium]
MKQELIARTMETWQPRCARGLSEEDAREIVENVTGFFKLLLEWEVRESESAISETDRSYYAMFA